MKEPPCLLEVEDDSGGIRRMNFLMKKSGWIKWMDKQRRGAFPMNWIGGGRALEAYVCGFLTVSSVWLEQKKL